MQSRGPMELNYQGLDEFLKLRLVFCCNRQKIQNMSQFSHLNGHNSGSKHDN